MNKNYITMTELKERSKLKTNIYYVKHYIGGYGDYINQYYSSNSLKNELDFKYMEQSINECVEYFILKPEYNHSIDISNTFLSLSLEDRLESSFSHYKEYFDKLVLDKLDKQIIESKPMIKILQGYKTDVFEQEITEFVQNKNIYNTSIATTGFHDSENNFYMTTLIHYTIPLTLINITTKKDNILKVNDKIYDPEIKDFLEVKEIFSTNNLDENKILNSVIDADNFEHYYTEKKVVNVEKIN